MTMERWQIGLTHMYSIKIRKYDMHDKIVHPEQNQCATTTATYADELAMSSEEGVKRF